MALIIEAILYLISFLVPKKNWIVFGAWNGAKYGDNPAYLAKNLHEMASYTLFWVGKSEIEREVPEYITFLDKDDWKTKWKLMKMKYAFVSHSYADLSQYNVFGRTTVIMMWHGVGIKALNNLQSQSFARTIIRKFLRQYDYFLASSVANKERILDLFKDYGAREDNILLTGQTRVQLFHEEKENTSGFKGKILSQMKDYTWISYMPTFRDGHLEEFSFLEITDEQKSQLDCLLKKYNAIILEKKHPNSSVGNASQSPYVLNITKMDIDTQELLLATDILITDYSSVAFDYLLLDRPIIYFCYDLDDYLEGDSGLYYEFDSIRAGKKADNFSDLLRGLEAYLDNKNVDNSLRKNIYDTMLTYDDGNASKRIIDYLDLKRRD